MMGVKKEMKAIENYVEQLERKIIEQNKQLEDSEKEIIKLREKIEAHNNLRELRIAWANGEIEN
tara:strand:+ start:132 stop:323 length:192 start_codon:yes stop_codon:yes gene_type:complete